MSINNTPDIGPYTELKPFRFWCQKVLPITYDDSLSYYELLCKVVDYLNKTMEDVDQMAADMGDFKTAYEELIAYVNNYFENLDVQNEINHKLDAMALDGTLSALIAPFLQEAIESIPGIVTDWLDDHVDPETGYVIDDTLTIADAAADAKAAGERIRLLLAAYASHYSPNLLPNDTTITPCYIPAGTKLTFSTSDGSTFTGYRQLHWYDKDRQHIDWTAGYSPNTKKTITTTVDIYYLQWQDYNDDFTLPYMLNFGEFALPYSVYKQRPWTFEYKGNPPADLNDAIEAGYYNLTTGHSNKPADYSGTAGLLEVFNAGLTRTVVFQRLTDALSPPNIYTRYITLNGGTISDWVKNVNKNDLEQAEILKHDFSLNGNYFDPNKATWEAGIYVSSSGNVSGGEPYEYAYAPLCGPGTYHKTGNKSIFGQQITNIALLDKNKVFKTYKVGTLSDGNYVSTFTLTEEEAEKYAYTVMHRDTTDTFVPKLFYEAAASPTRYALDPVYGFDTDKLYGKKLVCDGDSIANASSDNPKQKGGYFGRFKLNYQMTGKNYGVGGGVITKGLTYDDNTPRHSVADNIDTIYSEYPTLDYLLLEGGTNDADLIGQFVGDTPPVGFGSWTENDFSGSYTDTTFCGAVETMFYKAVSHWPTSKIGFIIPMEMGTNNNSLNNRKRYFDEIKKIAKKWHIPVLDLWETAGADARLAAFYDPNKTTAENVTAGNFYGDGQHPTSYGYDAIQDKIDAFIRSL